MSSFLRFATLTPENDVAQECLASLVDQQSQQGSGSRVNPVRAIARVSPNAPTTTPLTAPNHRAAEPRYQLDVAFDKGSGLNGTWTIGKPGSKNDANVDLPICSSRSRQLTPAQICEIYIHPRSGLLILRNTNVFHSIIYLQADGDTDVELRNGDEHVLHMTRNHLRIGPLDYVLDISVDNEEAYRVSRDRYEEMVSGLGPISLARQPRSSLEAYAHSHTEYYCTPHHLTGCFRRGKGWCRQTVRRRRGL